MSGTNFREASMAYLNIKDIEDIEEPKDTTSGLLSRTKSKSNIDSQPLDRVTRYVHTIRKKRNEIKNGRA
tara:strand:- start:2824 stop:3033 length:210 start_codon:yes stop_codon:yes gene_type:complete